MRGSVLQTRRSCLQSWSHGRQACWPAVVAAQQLVHTTAAPWSHPPHRGPVTSAFRMDTANRSPTDTKIQDYGLAGPLFRDDWEYLERQFGDVLAMTPTTSTTHTAHNHMALPSPRPIHVDLSGWNDDESMMQDDDHHDATAMGSLLWNKKRTLWG